jgi:hypothetical protein
LVKILYKGKGHTKYPNNYRGIMLENAFKIFTKVPNKKADGRGGYYRPEK